MAAWGVVADPASTLEQPASCQEKTIICLLIEMANPNGVHPRARLNDILGRIGDQEITRIDHLLSWRYSAAAA